ncbi:MAG TPA: hypothetical protein VGJ73_01655 [Verrucomicrobiae bacterium]|jgi:hypothetical protein
MTALDAEAKPLRNALKHTGDFQESEQRAGNPQSVEDKVKGIWAREAAAHWQDGMSAAKNGLVKIQVFLGRTKEVGFVPRHEHSDHQHAPPKDKEYLRAWRQWLAIESDAEVERDYGAGDGKKRAKQKFRPAETPDLGFEIVEWGKFDGVLHDQQQNREALKNDESELHGAMP